MPKIAGSLVAPSLFVIEPPPKWADRWLYGSSLPTSGFVPDDQPDFEAFVGRPFAHGTADFELAAQLAIRRA